MIGFVGLSHLGLVSSAAVAAKGFEVLGFDPDVTLCQDLGRGNLPVFEPGLAQLMEKHKSHIQFSCDESDLALCSLTYFSLDVPTNENGESDLSALNGLIERVLPHLQSKSSLIILCQVHPGFSRSIQERFQSLLVFRNINLFYQVETLIIGRAVERALSPERLIVGCRDPHNSLPPEYKKLLHAFECPVFQMRFESAELCKISINVCLAASVSVANTLAELCEATGADWGEIVPALKLDKRIGSYAYLNPGLGIGGGNLERDLVTVCDLAMERGTDAGIVEAFLTNSRYRRQWVFRAVHSKVVRKCANPKLAIWGLAYKADTKSTKNSPALSLIRSMDGLSLRGYDPAVTGIEEPNFTNCSSPLQACEGADALLVMTPWEEFSSVPLEEVNERMSGQLIIDPYRVLNNKRCRALGFQHVQIGEKHGDWND